MILGLDISTSITGASIIDKHGSLVYCEAWRTDKKGLTFYEKLDLIKQNVKNVKSNFKIAAIYVEEPMGMFARGRSSAQVISKIQRFNGATCWMVRELFNKEPHYIHVATARKAYGIKVPRGSNTKEIVLDNVVARETNFLVEYTRQGNCVKGTYDRADSAVVARAGYGLFNK
jgi:hypothetical protein